MKISIIGTGYVGLVSGAGLAERGHNVVCVDIDKEVVNLINRAESPIYEKGLESLLEKLVNQGKLEATTDIKRAVIDTEITFICVGTPSKKDGSIDISSIKKASRDIAKALSSKEGYHVVVVKSTVTPGITDGPVKDILEKSGKVVGEDMGLGMNPEFLREGVALKDFLEPDRVVIGGWDEKSKEKIKEVYSNFEVPKLVTDIRTAEMIKYASNSLLATKISFANEISRLCEKVGIDVYDVMDGVGLDHRINRDFLNAGPGFGGSCFPKDVKALTNLAENHESSAELLGAVLSINSTQPLHTVDILEDEIGDLKEKKIAVLGLAFKGGTDDVRETRALPIIETLQNKGAKVKGYDPEANENFAKLNDEIELKDNVEKALKNVDACIIQNDWKEFINLDSEDFKNMKNKVVLDSRRVLDNKNLQGDIIYLTIGRGSID